MRNDLRPRRWLLCCVAFRLHWPLRPLPKFAFCRRADRLRPTELDGFLRRAQQLEGEQRWGEALTVYEEALREHPDEPTIGDRHNLAKIHYDLGRRYSDSSFLRALTTLPERQAIGPVLRSAGEDRVALRDRPGLGGPGGSRHPGS